AEHAGIDALVAVYHADHRELCAHERDYPFRIMNVLEIVGGSMGLHHDDHFKRLKMLQDVDAIAADCQTWSRSTGSTGRGGGRRSRRCSTSSRCRCGVSAQAADRAASTQHYLSPPLIPAQVGIQSAVLCQVWVPLSRGRAERNMQHVLRSTHEQHRPVIARATRSSSL